MTKYLIFGDGLLGTAFKQQADTVVLSRLECDITNKEDIIRALDEFTPDVVVNCAGIVPKNKVPPGDMFKANSFAPHIISDICQGNSKFVHISTNCVFDGKRASYSERDLTNATDVYGVSKTLGEPDNAFVIRTSFVGLPDPNGRGLLAWAKTQDSIIGYDKVLWNGVTTVELVKKITELVKQDITGIRHIHGFTYSKYEVLKIANEILFGGRLNIQQETKITTNPHVENKTLMSLYDDGYVRIPIEQQLKELV